jgi:uncharacterized CHY-type Zn-finger protein
MANLKDAGHLFRMAAVFAVGIVLFLVLRGIFVPKTFGQYGHYRAAAITDVASRPVMFAGHQACEACHTDVHELKSKGVHARVACESCHGPLAKHADDPTALQPPHIDVAVLCVRCHEANIAKPKTFPQVVSADHSGGVVCDTCHKPHSPKIDTGVGP